MPLAWMGCSALTSGRCYDKPCPHAKKEYGAGCSDDWTRRFYNSPVWHVQDIRNLIEAIN
jgi:hypothetical protein